MQDWFLNFKGKLYVEISIPHTHPMWHTHSYPHTVTVLCDHIFFVPCSERGYQVLPIQWLSSRPSMYIHILGWVPFFFFPHSFCTLPANVLCIFLYTYMHLENIRSTYLLLRWRVGIDIIHSEHLDKDGSIAERIANGCKPWMQVAQNWHNCFISGRDDYQDHIQVENDGSYTYDVVQVGAREANESGGGKVRVNEEVTPSLTCLLSTMCP